MSNIHLFLILRIPNLCFFFSSFSGCWVLSNFVIFSLNKSCITYLEHLAAETVNWFPLIKHDTRHIDTQYNGIVLLCRMLFKLRLFTLSVAISPCMQSLDVLNVGIDMRSVVMLSVVAPSLFVKLKLCTSNMANI